jgi:Siphovirus ReqiPepy6 Gp37-like protein
MTLFYTAWIYDSAGQAVTYIDDFIDDAGASFTAARSVNTPGRLAMHLPAKYLPFFRNPRRWLDYRIGMFRRIDNGPEVLDTGTIYFVRNVVRRRKGLVRTITIGGPSAMQILKRRIVNAAAGSSGAQKTAAIDNMMKAIVREQFGSGAGAGRDISASLSVGADLSLGTSSTRAFSYDNVLEQLQDLAVEAGGTAVPLFFDVVAPTMSTLEFRVRAGQWGVNRTSSSGAGAVLLSSDEDTLADVTVEENYDDEVNVVYVGGAGQTSNRNVQSVSDATRIAASALNRAEAFASYTNSNAPSVLMGYGNTVLRAGRPKKRMEATLVSSPTAQYGKHWNYGDKLTANDAGDVFDARIDSITIAMQGGVARAAATLRSET